MPTRTDVNQSEIVSGLRQAGASVQDLHAVGHGCPDILVGFRERNFLLEIKTEGGKLRESQETFRDNWHGQTAVVRTLEEALDAIGAIDLGDTRLRPDCPHCQQRLTSYIGHNTTRCPGCGRVWRVGWNEHQLEVV